MRLGPGALAWVAVATLACGEEAPPLSRTPPVVVEAVDRQAVATPEPAPAQDPPAPTMRALVDPGSGALRLEDLSGGLLLRIRTAVRSAGGRTAREAQRATARHHSIDGWRVEGGEDGAWSATADVRTSTSTWRVRMHHPPAGRWVDIDGRLVYSQATYVGQDTLVLRFSGAQAATLLNRGYHTQPAESGMVVDAWTPQRVDLEVSGAQVSLEGRAQAMRVEGDPDKVLQIALEADHHENHPLRTLESCAAVYDREVQPDRADRSAWPRRAGDTHTVRARLHLGPGPGLLPLRYPSGQRSALVFTDHADQSNLPRLRALMYGRSDGGPGQPQTGGFVGHGLTMTKTVFHRSRIHQSIQLSEPDYAAVLTDLVAAGIEVGPHSVGDGPDKRERTAESLPAYRAIGGAPVWIDHQPATNCEAISSEGGDRSSRYYLVDLLKSAGYRYVWAGSDVREPQDGINLFEPARGRARAPVLYAHTAIDPDLDTPLRLFSSVWRLYTAPEFLDRFSDTKLGRLEADRGLHIAHTYLDAHTHTAGLSGKTLLSRTSDGYTLLPSVQTWLGGLAHRQAEGRLWVAGIVAVADHLVAMSEVQLRGWPGRVRVQAETRVTGASFLVPGGAFSPHVDGQPLRSSAHREEREGTVLWMDLEPGVAREITWDPGLAVPTQ